MHVAIKVDMMCKILSHSILILLFMFSKFSYSEPWEERKQKHSEYKSSIKDDGLVAGQEIKLELEEYDALYRRFAHEMIITNDFVDHDKDEYSRICNTNCGPLILVLENYLHFIKTGDTKYIKLLIDKKDTQEAFFDADSIIRPDLIDDKKVLVFFVDYGLVRSVLYMLYKSAESGNNNARDLLKQIEGLSDGENKMFSQEYLEKLNKIKGSDSLVLP